jgi:hypothetical protein
VFRSAVKIKTGILRSIRTTFNAGGTPYEAKKEAKIYKYIL